MGISFFKIALLISYLRLFDRTNQQRIYRRIVLATITLIFLSHVGCSLALIFACNPVSALTPTFLASVNVNNVLIIRWINPGTR